MALMPPELPVLAPDAEGLEHASTLLRAGLQVAFPTETVYGLGADAMNDHAVAGIYAAKSRPEFNPLIVHVADLDMARRIARFDGPEGAMAERLAAAFWPGPLTLVLPLRDGAGISRLVTAGLDSVALRLPAHPVAQALLQRFGGPLAAPSANPSGRISPTSAAHVVAGLSGRIAAVIDGGACGVGLESTILSLVDGQNAGGPNAGGPILLRAGGVPVEALAEILGAMPRQGEHEGPRPVAPGQLVSHYAPRGQVRLNAHQAEPGEMLLGFGPMDCDLNLSVAGDLTEAAANLFAHLHRLDAQGAERIAVAQIPMTGLGLAVNDRLARAAAPRDTLTTGNPLQAAP